MTGAEASLRARDVSHLPPKLQRARRANLGRLRAYRLAGEFPRNTVAPGRRIPIFIDEEGRLCAMAHLVMTSGHEEAARPRDDQPGAERLARLADQEAEFGALLRAQRGQLATLLAGEHMSPEQAARFVAIIDEAMRARGLGGSTSGASARGG